MRVEGRDSCMQKSSNAFGARVHGAVGPSARRLLTVKRLKGKPFYVQAREALIKSLSAFILGFLCTARNGTTRIASYLRSPMTKQCIKILIKADSMN